MFTQVRSLLYVPGTRPSMLQNSPYFGADAIILDLEDAVALSEKDAARNLVAGTLRHVPFGKVRTVVRVNDMNTPFFEADMRKIIPCRPDAIRLPKVETAEEIRQLDVFMAELEQAAGIPIGSIEVHPILETAIGVFNADSIAFAAKRLTTLNMGGQDLAADMGVTKTPDGEQFMYARCKVLLAARAAGIVSHDTVYTDIEDLEGLYQETKRMANFGYVGKSAIHPSQIRTIHRAYAPEQAAVEKALRIVRAAKVAYASGVGAYTVDGMMVDGPVVDQARNVLNRAKLAGMLDPAELEAV